RRMVHNGTTFVPKYYVERFSRDIMEFLYGGSWSELPDSSMWQYLDSYKRSTDVTIGPGPLNLITFGGFEHLDRRPGWYILDGGREYIKPTPGSLVLPAPDGTIGFQPSTWSFTPSAIT